MAKQDDISVDQFFSTSVAEKLAALLSQDYLAKLAKGASREKYEAALKKAPRVKPPAPDTVSK